MHILMPLPHVDFDPTESAVPWAHLTQQGHQVHFATPDGGPASADPRMLTGRGLGPWRRLLQARADARLAYDKMSHSQVFGAPRSYAELDAADFDALVLPGGHAPGMTTYLESSELQALVAAFMAADKPVGAICHGVVLAARSAEPDTGKSVLHGRKTTALTRSMEMSAFNLTRLWLGDYYRTYPTPVQDEVTAALAAPDDFAEGPFAVLRDTPDKLDRGFTVRDANYLSARWPGDAYRFAHEFAQMLDGE